MLKKCPTLRTIVWKICCYSWENNHFPAEWKNSTTIFIHKKGNTVNPSYFRPITLSQFVTSHIPNRIFTFPVENMQKKQQQLVIMLFGLQNPFGDVHHKITKTS